MITAVPGKRNILKNVIVLIKIIICYKSNIFRGDKCCDYSGVDWNRCYSCCGCDTESCADSDKCYCHTGESHCATAAPSGRSRRSPRRRSAPGPATLDSLYYEPFRSKSRSVIDHKASGLDYLHHKSSR